jgi:hypothetical protein
LNKEIQHDNPKSGVRCGIGVCLCVVKKCSCEFLDGNALVVHRPKKSWATAATEISPPFGFKSGISGFRFRGIVQSQIMWLLGVRDVNNGVFANFGKFGWLVFWHSAYLLIKNSILYGISGNHYNQNQNQQTPQTLVYQQLKKWAIKNLNL